VRLVEGAGVAIRSASTAIIAAAANGPAKLAGAGVLLRVKLLLLAAGAAGVVAAPPAGAASSSGHRGRACCIQAAWHARRARVGGRCPRVAALVPAAAAASVTPSTQVVADGEVCLGCVWVRVLCVLCRRGCGWASECVRVVSKARGTRAPQSQTHSRGAQSTPVLRHTSGA
jgi:hypothetical protein